MDHRRGRWNVWRRRGNDSRLHFCLPPTAPLSSIDGWSSLSSVHIFTTNLIQLESLRLYPPVVKISRSTDFPQVVRTSNQTIRIPSNAVVYINNPGLHTNPETWGEDVLDFRPSRWMNEGAKTEQEQLITPAQGAFSPWSGGPRVCPGQKMSQVEFVAVISSLFRHADVEPVLFEGESIVDARQRLIAITMDSQPELTLNMKRPKDIVLRWKRRSSVTRMEPMV
jgi:hypothetical protein